MEKVNGDNLGRVDFEIDINEDGEAFAWKRPGVDDHIADVTGTPSSETWLTPVDDWIKEHGLCG